jgi:hypothetical protein
MKNTKFFTDFTYSLEKFPSSLKATARIHLKKALNGLFNKLKSENENTNLIVGIILKVKLVNGSIKSLSTLRKGNLNSFSKFSTLFKHLLNLRSEHLSKDSDERLKAVSIIFAYHIFPLDYNKDQLMEDD